MKNIFLSILISLSTIMASAQDDNVIYSFKTTKNKTVQLILDEQHNIFTFRLLSFGRVKLEVTDDLRDNDTIFTVNGYHRGGGAQNAAMDYNTVMFGDNEYYYEIYYVWAVNEYDPEVENDPVYGLKVYKEGIETKNYKGRKVITGEVYGWSFYDILPVAGEE